MIVTTERERKWIVHLWATLTQLSGSKGPSKDPTTFAHALSLSLFICCASREAEDNIEYISNDSSWLNHRASEWGVRLEGYRSHTSRVGRSRRLVPLQGHFLSAAITRNLGAQPAALVYYKRRDCSKQSLQQRTFKLHFIFFSLSLSLLLLQVRERGVGESV